MFKRWLIITGLLLTAAPSVLGLDAKKAITQYQHRVWTTEHGLPQNTASCVVQTADGYLWIGTSEGLGRFDGVQFKVFDKNNTPAIKNHTILSMLKDRTNNLWLGTQEGLVALKDGIFTAFTTEQGMPAGSAENLYEDRSGALWFRNREVGLVRYKDGKFTAFPLKDAILNFYGQIICEDPAGNILIGTSRGVLQLKAGQFANYSTLLPGGEVWAIYTDPAGALWVAIKDQGLYRLKDGAVTLYTTKEGLVHNDVLALHNDRDGNLWLGTSGGLTRFTDGQMTSFTANDGLSDNVITSFCEDREGNLWVGTNAGGINQFRDGKFTVYTLKEGLPSKVPKLVEDRTGTIWAVSRQGQAAKLTDGGFVPATLDHDLLLPRPLATTVNPTLGPLSLSLTDRAGRVWTGTYGAGVTVSKDGINTSYTTSNGLPTNAISLIYEDRQGNIWIGTFSAGLVSIKDGKFTYYTRREGLESDIIRYLSDDADGNLWIGTGGGGLHRLRNGKITAYTRREGLFDDTIFQILEDGDKNLWMSSNRGIFRVSRTALDEFDQGRTSSINAIAYGRADGLRNPECTGGVNFALKSRDGRLWFVTIDGVAVIDPANIRLNRVPPPTLIEEIRVDGRPLLPNQSLQLPASVERLEFHYTALSFAAPEKVRFQFILDGHDKSWNEAGARRTAYYSNLRPGRYTFKVRACNNDGVWSEAVVPLQFEIPVPAWQSWWAYSLYLLAVFTAGYGGIQWRLRALRRRNEQLEAKILQRTEVIEEQKKDLTRQKEELATKNAELERINIELLESHQRADRIFSALAEALPGTVLDEKYRLDEKIGSGGFGTVYRGTHLAMNRPIAVKIFKPIPGNDSAKSLERFRLEAIAASRINHANAVAVLDSGISREGLAYIVMELLNGHSLARELKERGALTVNRALEILLPICDVLVKAHELGLVHRDIKPENIFLHKTGEGETIKIVDFGIAKFAQERVSVDIKDLTASNNLIGTPLYMAPERIMGQCYDGRADIYSLGVMIYQMLSGKLPFTSTAGNEGNMVAMLMQHVNDTPPSVRNFNSAIPEGLAALVMRMLSKQPEARPTARELEMELTKLSGRWPADSSATAFKPLPDQQEPATLKMEELTTETQSLRDRKKLS